MDGISGNARRNYTVVLTVLSAAAWLGPCLWITLTQPTGFTDIVLPAVARNTLAWPTFGIVSTVFLVIALVDQYLIVLFFRQFDKLSVPHYDTRLFYSGYCITLTVYFCLTIFFFSADILEFHSITSVLIPAMYLFGALVILVIAFLGLKYFSGLRFWHAFFKAVTAKSAVQANRM